VPTGGTERLGGEMFVAALKRFSIRENPEILRARPRHQGRFKGTTAASTLWDIDDANGPGGAAKLPTMVENAVASVPASVVVNVNLVWRTEWTRPGCSDGSPRAQYVGDVREHDPEKWKPVPKKDPCSNKKD